ncbi:erythromycin esterase family protein [Nonomuraea sp. SMC257]|uniref:Erythromycin esterase family protein n=1 Tax=Nonomuraea montanisoli TaxID=2741721 RepID=A0A7Y6I1M6_9ACTN|nr:erythromycin esterase family protein [Nonomuraea montanisoli]NUW30057.1 erythromycin esterase family protein [Nonomuraea montanisoli]
MNKLSLLTFGLVAALAAPILATPAHATSAKSDKSDKGVVAGLDRYARPLSDLDALSEMTRDASIVGIGEVTHGSKELFTVRNRMFRHLVSNQGFTTIALEAPWSAGVRLDEYIRTGKGDLRTIMREDFQQAYGFWQTKEWMDLYTWMREYNRTARHKLRVMGFDMGDVHPDQYRRVIAWAEKNKPAIAPELRRRYADLLALPGGTAERMDALAALPAERHKTLAENAEAAYRLVEKAPPIVAQEARVIAQMATLYTLDGPAMHRHRDRSMAENTWWWNRHTGLKTVAAAHNGHIGYVSAWPDMYPVTQGAHLRAMAGKSYVAIGTTIHSGRFRAMDPKTGKIGVFDTGAPGTGSSEHTLDKVRHRDYLLSLRQAGQNPAVRTWLDTARPTYTIPATYMPEMFTKPLALGKAYDSLIHLHRVKAADPL